MWTLLGLGSLLDTLSFETFCTTATVGGNHITSVELLRVSSINNYV